MRTFNTVPWSFKTLILGVALVFGGAAVGVACVKGESLVPSAKADHQKTKVVINLKQGSNDLRAAVMALELATAMAESGADVTIYASLEGVRLFDARQPDLRCGVSDKTIAHLYERFMDAGGHVLVCPLCAEVAGISKDNLRSGARLGTMEQVTDLMVAAEKVIDY